MRAAGDAEQKQEIIIVRRARHDEDEAHHGGVWKIAFADFMTAMMCFFLVMWLINAANEETRAALASYFNPVKLIDRNSSRKGLDELGGPQSIESTPENLQDSENLMEPGSSASDSNASSSNQNADADLRSDEHLFSDPYAVLAEIAADTGMLQNISSKGEGGAQESGPASGASGGQSYRDPFAPDFWSQQVDVPDAAATAQPTGGAENTAHGEVETIGPSELQDTPETAAAGPAEAPEETGGQALEESANEAAGKPHARDVVSEHLHAEPETAPQEPKAPEPASETETAGQEPEQVAEAKATESAEVELEEAARARAEEAERTAEDIRRELAEAIGGDGELVDGMSVTVTDEGVVISITDELDSGMFEIGSAVPRRDLVIAMEKIGRILSDRRGPVVINGHTDGRPFKSDTYDNWRLSTARAHSAYFMLVRGGLDERRIVEVAGFADRELKVADDPLADANRRIEILLRSDG